MGKSGRRTNGKNSNTNYNDKLGVLHVDFTSQSATFYDVVDNHCLVKISVTVANYITSEAAQLSSVAVIGIDVLTIEHS